MGNDTLLRWRRNDFSLIAVMPRHNLLGCRVVTDTYWWRGRDTFVPRQGRRSDRYSTLSSEGTIKVEDLSPLEQVVWAAQWQ